MSDRCGYRRPPDGLAPGLEYQPCTHDAIGIVTAKTRAATLVCAQCYDLLMPTLKLDHTRTFVALEPLLALAERQYYHCRWCGESPEEYMVSRELWQQAFPEYEGLKGLVETRFTRSRRAGMYERTQVAACLSCLAARLARPLTLKDFPEMPANLALRAGYYMHAAERDTGRTSLEPTRG